MVRVESPPAPLASVATILQVVAAIEPVMVTVALSACALPLKCTDAKAKKVEAARAVF